MMPTVVMATAVEARRRQERLRVLASSVRDGMDKIASLVAEAKESNDHEALGYRSWTEYLSDTLGAEPMHLGAPDRREVTALLAGEGMTVRTIAPIVNASKSTVDRDLRLSQNGTVERPERVMSRDGVERPSTQPPKPRRNPLPDTFGTVTYDLTRKVESLVRLTADDRFPQNAQKVAARNRSDLQRAIDALQRVVDQLDTSSTL